MSTAEESKEWGAIVTQHGNEFHIELVRKYPSDLAKQLHAKFLLTAHLAWSEVEALLVELCGPLNRRKRCERCGGEGVVVVKHKAWWYEGTMLVKCPDCDNGYQKGGE